MRNLPLFFLALAPTIPACSSSGPPPLDGGALQDASASNDAAVLDGATPCSPTPPPISCNSVLYGSGGTPADLPSGSCGNAAWKKLIECAGAKCSTPCAGVMTYEAPRPQACDDCITVSCAAEVAACHDAL